MSTAGAYAIETTDGIDVATISPTEEGAKVNWLLTRVGLMMFESHRGEYVNRMFDTITEHRPAKVVAVTITKEQEKS